MMRELASNIAKHYGVMRFCDLDFRGSRKTVCETAEIKASSD